MHISDARLEIDLLVVQRWTVQSAGACIADRMETRRRQELPLACLPNGALYIARIDWYREHRTFVTSETVGYLMPPERSLDVDTALDMTMIRAVVSQPFVDGGSSFE